MLYKLKPSVIRVFTSVLTLSGVAFKCCSTPEELEKILVQIGYPKDEDKKVTFNISTLDTVSVQSSGSRDGVSVDCSPSIESIRHSLICQLSPVLNMPALGERVGDRVVYINSNFDSEEV